MFALEGIVTVARRAWEYLLDTVAPPDPLVRSVEAAGAAGLASRAKRAEEYGAVALFPYKDEHVRAALVEIKTYINRKLVRTVAEAAHGELLKELARQGLAAAGPLPLLIPVPMTRKSLRERGWNQCELVAKEMARLDGGRSFELGIGTIAKVRQTGDQVGKDRAARAENLKGCFRARDLQAIQGRTVIVFDDVLTTGATLSEARRAAEEAGAARVLCVAVAH